MSVREMKELLGEQAFFQELTPDDLALIAGCARNRVFRPGQFIAHESDPADDFYLIRSGEVAVQIFVPERGAVTLQTLGPGEILGWSWLFPPYRWTFDARSIDEVHVIALDGKCLRGKAESDSALGYRLMKKFAQIMTERLRATRLQILDVYGVFNQRGA